MSNEARLSSISVPRSTDARHPARASRYFPGMAVFLLVIVIVGFSRTLFLRPLFQVPALPWYDYVHGSVMTLWFVLLVVQTSLVAAHRTDLHRRLGIFGAVLAVAVVALGLTVTLRFPAHFRVSNGILSTGLPPASPSVALSFLWGDIEALSLFSIMVGTALMTRRWPETHKRLMLLASIAVITPAVGRITTFPDLSGIASSAPAVASFLTILVVALIVLLPLTLVAHDLLIARRLHRVTIWGVLGSLAMGFAFTNVIPATAVGRAMWRALL
jgi:hypothetical protein